MLRPQLLVRGVTPRNRQIRRLRRRQWRPGSTRGQKGKFLHGSVQLLWRKFHQFLEEPVEQPTRWLLKPHERVRLNLKFFSEEPVDIFTPGGFKHCGY